MATYLNVGTDGKGGTTVTAWGPLGGGTWTYYEPTTTFIPAAAVSTSTGVSPLETSYSLYNHTIPQSVFGVG